LAPASSRTTASLLLRRTAPATAVPSRSSASIDLKRDRIDYWTSKGAQLSETVGKLLTKHKPTEATPAA
jgi:ribosomal protein S16